ncbi:hypothetical protein [Streptacidiphilus sp. P02-A3a]|uniref:hypothetical protein n=1 Tax=Streptacidiphilus sp. P02-A3a TaxID=2704468 RepID=UPI0015FA1A6F|nr:hypothetical protein [Streptacidiphilus sp. P02-A3a]QMU68865.1 hypothetical protein GXP74_12120 [Streptacidiphilus sp. P02-A3a]
MTPLADAAAVVLAAGTLSSLVTTPLWLRSRHHAAALGRELAANAAENQARAAETRHLIEVRIPAMLARLTFPHLPVPGLLHPQFTGSALDADHHALLEQVASVAAQAQPRPVEQSTAADWFEPRHRAPGAARSAPYLAPQPPTPQSPPSPRHATSQPSQPESGWVRRRPDPPSAPGAEPRPHPQPHSFSERMSEPVSERMPEPMPEAAPEPAPPASGLHGSSAVWSAFQSGTESGRAAVEHHFADRARDAHHFESHHEGSL